MVRKKFFAKAFALAMATGLLAVATPSVIQVWATGGVQQPEEKKAQPVKAEVCYGDMTVVITPGKDADKNGDNYVFLEVMKKKDDTKEGTVYAFPCSDGRVTVDLSFLKIAKESYLRVWGDKSGEKVTLTVSAQPAKIKYKYATQAFPELKDTADKTGDALKSIQAENQQMLIDYYAKSFGITDTTLDYSAKSLYGGTWIELIDGNGDGKWDLSDEDQLKTVKVTGTTLVICQMPKDNTYKKDATTGADTDEIDKAGTPVGAEVKIKVPAAPKAPKITIDYAKGTIKLPKNAEYGIIEDGEIAYVALANGGTLSPKEILGNIADKLGKKDDATAQNEADKTAKTDFVNSHLATGFNLVVRTNDAKKGASNPAFVAVKETVTYDDDNWGKITLKATETGKEPTEIATYEFSDAGVTVTAKVGSFEYEEGGKWKKISSGKVIKGKTSELTIRMAGVKDKDVTKATLPSAEMTIKKPVDKSAVEFTTNVTEVEETKDISLTVNTTAGKLLDRNGQQPEDVTKVTYKWESSDSTIAKVTGTTATSTITGVKEGKCTITVTITFEDKSTTTKSVEITVKKLASGT